MKDSLFFLLLFSFSCSLFYGDIKDKIILSEKEFFSIDFKPLDGDILIYADMANGKPLKNPLEIDFSLNEQSVIIMGWAADRISMKPASAIYLKVGDYYFKAEYGLERNDVEKHFGKSELAKTGYKVAVPRAYLALADKIEFILISAEGTGQYKKRKILSIN